MPKVTTFPTGEQGKTVPSLSDQKIQKETILEYLKVFGFEKTLSAIEIQQFTQTALAGNLDPFKREIYVAVYGEGENRKATILTGYQVYLKRAERTGNLDGWRAWLEGDGNQMKAIVEIFRKDWSHSFTHEVYWEEAVQKKKDGHPTQFWAKQPRFQLRKVAIAQGFRLAFPDELGGLPYESAELPDNDNAPVNLYQTSLPQGDEETVNTPNHDSSEQGLTANLAAQALADDPPPANTVPGNPEKVRPPVNKAQDTTSHQQDSDTEDDFLEKTIQRIEAVFEAHPDDFTEKHQAWILDKVYKAPDKAGIQKMLAYTEKVVKKATA